MSAIFGLIRFDGGEASSRDLERMGDILAHRGPDGRKVVVDGPVGLGHCLMRVNQEDLFEAQPLHDREADLTLVADCRIDNREALAAAFGLSADATRDMPDSAFILRAYKKWGEDCAAHLLGDFAFAVWDASARKLFLARDHMGVRQVQYYCNDSLFVFATEIKALWAVPDVPRELNDAGVARYLLMDLRARDSATFFKDIYGVAGGTTLSVGADGAVSRRRYWRPQAAPEHRGQDQSYYIEHYRRILAEAVRCRIDRLLRPPALSFSGGFDSAGIAALSGPILSRQGRKMVSIAAVAQPGNIRAAEALGARHWVDLCKQHMPHLDVRYFVRDQETWFSQIERVRLVADCVPLPGQYANNAIYGEAARAGARLILDGIGGNVTLNPHAGRTLAYFARTGRFRRLYRELRAVVRGQGHSHGRALSYWRLLRHFIVPALLPDGLRKTWLMARYGATPLLLTDFAAAGFVREALDSGAVDPWRGERASMRASTRECSLRGLLDLSARALSDLVNEAAAHGLDVARPMYDKRAVEFGLAVPEEFDLVNGRDRFLARRALGDVLPAEYQTRRTSRYDGREPDSLGHFQSALPRVREEALALTHDVTVKTYIDIPSLQRAIMSRRSKLVSAREAHAIFRTIQVAHYTAWFAGKNKTGNA